VPEHNDAGAQAIDLRLAVDLPLNQLGEYGRRLAVLGRVWRGRSTSGPAGTVWPAWPRRWITGDDGHGGRAAQTSTSRPPFGDRALQVETSCTWDRPTMPLAAGRDHCCGGGAWRAAAGRRARPNHLADRPGCGTWILTRPGFAGRRHAGGAPPRARWKTGSHRLWSMAASVSSPRQGDLAHASRMLGGAWRSVGPLAAGTGYK
jgi:hypothetical protein